MKKIISVFSVVMLLCLFPLTTFASDECQVIKTENGYIEYFEDGSYGVVEILDIKTVTRATGVNKSKTYVYYNSNDELEWSVTITGTFNYNGSTASCTNAVTSYKIYNDRWKVTASSASRSGATARGDFTLKRYLMGIPTKTVDKTVTLTCSKTGVFS